MSENIFVDESQAKVKEVNFATVEGVYEDGLSIRLDGEEKATEKHYKCNTAIVFKVGDRVRIIRDSGTYVVEYPVGNPTGEISATNVTESINGVPISSIFESNGTTVKRATTVTGAVSSAVNVTTNINGKAIASIFESNGTTAKNATNVTTNINGKAITTIFETNGTTAKKIDQRGDIN